MAESDNDKGDPVLTILDEMMRRVANGEPMATSDIMLMLELETVRMGHQFVIEHQARQRAADDSMAKLIGVERGVGDDGTTDSG